MAELHKVSVPYRRLIRQRRWEIVSLRDLSWSKMGGLDGSDPEALVQDHLTASALRGHPNSKFRGLEELAPYVVNQQSDEGRVIRSTFPAIRPGQK